MPVTYVSKSGVTLTLTRVQARHLMKLLSSASFGDRVLKDVHDLLRGKLELGSAAPDPTHARRTPG